MRCNFFSGLHFYTLSETLIACRDMQLRLFKVKTLLNNAFKPKYAWRKSLVWAVNIPIKKIKKLFSPPLIWWINYGLGERPINPQGRYAPAFLFYHDWLTGQCHIRDQFTMLLHDTTAVVLITLGLITLGVCYERVSRIAAGGGGLLWIFLNWESSMVIQSKERCPILVWMCGVPSQRETFVIIVVIYK